ncbi:MAG: nucleoside deaminase [Bacteroidota bacterium]
MEKFKDEQIMRRVYALAWQNAEQGLDPFAAVLVKDGQIVAESADLCVLESDPTAHAELALIRSFCRKHERISLEGYSLFCNVEPCVMCSGAIHWARLDRLVYGVGQKELQSVSGGKPKPGCRELINSGGKPMEIDGPVLPEEGLRVLQAFPFQSKKARHQKLYGSS